MGQRRYSTVIFGCGNVIMGDDGFGPAVIEELNTHYTLPHSVAAVDAGTGVREYLFDYLLVEDERPRRIIILEAFDVPGKKPGDVFSIDPAAIPDRKVYDFSLHQFPGVNLLSELEIHAGVNVDILAAQVECFPDEIAPGLSPSMKRAIPEACDKIMKILSVNSQTR